MRLDSVWQDVRHGLRSWRSQPLLYGMAVAALALGIGANTTIFSVVDAVLLRPLPYQHEDRIVSLYEHSPKKGIEHYFVSSSDYFDWQDRSRTLEAFGGYWRHDITLTETGRDAERIPGLSTTPSLLRTLSLRTVAGRGLTEQDVEHGAPDVALITYELWQRRYGGDPAAVGNTVGIDGGTVPIVGVLEPGVHFAGDAQVWNVLVPYRPRPTPRFMEAVARLRPGVGIRQAQAEMDSLARSIAAEFPDTNAGWEVTVRGLHDDLTGSSRPALILLLASVSLLLLIACANVANLLLAHASARQHEVALRAALGAGMGRLVRQFFTESLLLAMAGGGAGLLVAVAGVRAVRAWGPGNLPQTGSIAIHLPMLFYTLAISVAAGLLFGMAPAWRIRRPELALAMKQSGRGFAGGRFEGRGRGLLVIAQVALAVVLVNGAGLLMKSFARLSAVNPGFRTENVLTAGISLPGSRYRQPQDVSMAFDRILRAARELPGVKAAGHTTTLPLAGELDYRVPFYFLSLPRPRNLEDQTAWHRMVSPGLFSALGTRILSGRDFSERDRADAPAVAIVNETLARQYWPNGSPIGQKLHGASGGFGPLGRIILTNPEVVGVVADIRYEGMGKNAEPAIYFPSLQAPFYSVTLVVRTDASISPEALISSVRRKLGEIDPNLPLAHVRTMSEQVADSLAQPRFQTLLLAGFSGVALLLGSIGIYGVLSYGVAVRTREIGIRSALGGRPGDIQRLILGQGLRLTVSGVAIGMAASLAVGRMVEALLFEVRPGDLGTYAAVCGLLAGVGLAAGYLPARAASRIDPNVALRQS
ncbi:MAG TPA: ABC transporter permease [Bryobacteraceae bacterium]